MYLPSAQVEKAVHQLQDSKAICQMESAACPRVSRRGWKVGRGGSRGEIDYTCYMRDSGSALKVVLEHLHVQIGFRQERFSHGGVCAAERVNLQLG